MEIRAHNLSGECDFVSEAMKGHVEISSHIPKCVRRKALNSMRARGCDLHEREEALSLAWDVCYHDKEPFRKPPFA